MGWTSFITVKLTVRHTGNFTSMNSLHVGKMDHEFLSEILSQMVKSGKAAWIPTVPKSSTALIYWRKPEEWAQMIYKFVDRIGGIGSIYTVYDLIEGDDSHKEGKNYICTLYNIV